MPYIEIAKKMQLNQKPIRRDPKKVLRESRFLPPGGTHTSLPFWEKFFLLKLFKKKKEKILNIYLLFIFSSHHSWACEGKVDDCERRSSFPPLFSVLHQLKKQNTNFLGYFKLFSQLKKIEITTFKKKKV
jgi:hypothetical protein